MKRFQNIKGKMQTDRDTLRESKRMGASNASYDEDDKRYEE
jgi:hypothetical protein